MNGHRKASILIGELTTVAESIVMRGAISGDKYEQQVGGLRAEMEAAAFSDPSGRGQFINGAPMILADCLKHLLFHRRGNDEEAAELARDWQTATCPFIFLARADSYRALKYERAENVS